ncbi:MAG: hypothetical protein GY770_06550 [Aestuariibacter sp.]|nr:hypothetical protein [Aestuariibacter sp.]
MAQALFYFFAPFSSFWPKTVKNGLKWPKNEVFATFLKNGAYDFSKNLTKPVALCLLAMLEKLAQKKTYFLSYNSKTA